jgi:uncharacterized membrane protein YuzA (DUF378 family)
VINVGLTVLQNIQTDLIDCICGVYINKLKANYILVYISALPARLYMNIILKLLNSSEPKLVYLKQNTTRFQYKEQLLNAVWGDNLCLF